MVLSMTKDRHAEIIRKFNEHLKITIPNFSYIVYNQGYNSYVIDQDGEKIDSLEQLDDFSKLYLQAVRNHVLTHKIEHGNLENYLGVPFIELIEQMEALSNKRIPIGIMYPEQVCSHFELTKHHKEHFYVSLTQKGWNYLEQYNL